MSKRISELVNEIIDKPAVSLEGRPVKSGQKNRVHILALGDVGATMLIGLKLLGADVISAIGIYDIQPENLRRLEMEMNQIGYPDGEELPAVEIIDEERLFDCDVMIFCASKGVPPVEGGAQQDVRMVQLEANREIIAHYAALAKRADYQGLVCIVSDPVDPLATAFLDASGLRPWQIQGYGLGVMAQRALYYAKQAGKTGEQTDAAMARYLREGRAFGPHGEDLVIANSIEHYDDEASRELTRLAVEANLRVRELGYKPYIAPALSSAALSILMTLRGQWHYGSLYFGDETRGAFLGLYNRLTENGWEYEDDPLPDALYERIMTAYQHLCALRQDRE